MTGQCENRGFHFTTSWDDGTTHDFRLAELLAKYNLPATFYIARKHDYGQLSESEVKELGKSFELGAHTLNHTILDSVSDELAASEINNSKEWIEQLSGRPCRMFCFPQGKFRPSQVALLKEAGFLGARTVELISTSLPRISHGIAMMPTTMQAFPHDRFSYLKNIVKRSKIENLQTYLFHMKGRDWTSRAQTLVSHVAEHGGVFHLWGHAWELEKYDLWANLARFFQTATELRNRGEYCSNGFLCSVSRTN